MLRFKGGANKRKKGSDEEATDRHGIQPFFGDLPVLDGDASHIKEALAMDMTKIDDWLGGDGMSVASLKCLPEASASGKGLCDQNLRAMSLYHPIFQKVEVMSEIYNEINMFYPCYAM